MTSLEIGEIQAGGGPAQLIAEGFNRHTFWTGQSGSGKTYALGLVLEQLLLQTGLELLVLDPNGDFVHLGEPRDGAPADEAERIGALPVEVLGGPGDANPATVRFTDLSLASKAAVLHLDPLLDVDEYNVLVQYDAEAATVDQDAYLKTLRESTEAGRQRLARRIENLGVLRWDVWSHGRTAIEDVLGEHPRATVVDLSGFRNPDEPRTAALSVLDYLWERRHERSPRLIVIDEAHNLSTPTPHTALERALTERINQIAAEGRKYGLWLLLSTQRPGKVHPNAITQCDNLALMKLASPRDLQEIAAVFGFAPPGLVEQAPKFVKGQALFAGGFIDAPSIVRMGDRITRQGGSDVAVPVP